MVAKRGTKRQAVAEAPAAKKAKIDPKLEGIFEAIARAADLPESCRNMLQASASLAFATPQEQRHDVQNLVVSMIGEVIEGVHVKLQAAVDAQGVKLGEAESRRSELQSAIQAAEKVLSAATQDTEVKTKALTQASEAVSLAEATLQEKQESQRNGDAAMVQAKETKAALERCIEDHLQVIVAGTSEELVQHYNALLPLVQDIVVDESLLSALPSVCSKKSGDRGSFDSMVLDQLSELMQARITELRKIVDEALPASQERAAAVQYAQAKSEEASRAHEVANEALTVASSARQVAQRSLQSAEGAMGAFEPECAGAVRARNEQADKLENFQLYNINCFKTLMDTPTIVTASAGA